MADKPLTEPQLRVLRAAQRGDLYRSESIGSLYKTFDHGDGFRNVTAAVDRLSLRETRLLELDEQRGLRRQWRLTDAGRDALAERDAR